MKKQAYVCAPWFNIAWKIGALLIGAGYITAFVLNREYFLDLVDGKMYEAAIHVLLLQCIPVLFSGMLFTFEKYDLRFLAAMMIGFGMLTSAKGFLLGLLDPTVFLTALLLITAIGGRWNVSIKVGVLKCLATPWLSLFSFLIALVMALYYYAIKEYGGMVSCLGYAVIFLFSQPMPRSSIRKDPFYHSYFESADMTLTLAGVFLALSCLVTWLFSGKFLFENFYSDFGVLSNLMDEFSSPLLSICLLLAVFEAVKIFSVKYRNLLWLALIFLFVVTCSGSYGQFSYLVLVYLMLIVSAVGFSGNAPVVRSWKFDMTLVELVAFVFICAYAICAAYRLGEVTYGIVSEQPHVMTKAYKIYCMDTVLRKVQVLLVYLVLILTVLGSKTEEGVNGICWFFGVIVGWVKKFAAGFQRNSGKKIQKLAYIVSSICIVLTALSVGGFALFLCAGLCSRLSAAMKMLLPDYPYFILALSCFGSAVFFAVSAVSTWYAYSFGQIAADVHSIPKMLISRTVNKAAKADDTPDR